MGQGEITEVLLANEDEWMTAREIATILQANLDNIRKNLRRLRLHNEVEYTFLRKNNGKGREVLLYRLKK